MNLPKHSKYQIYSKYSDIRMKDHEAFEDGTSKQIGIYTPHIEIGTKDPVIIRKLRA